MNSGQLILSHEGPGRMLNVSFDSNGDKLAATSYSSVNIIPLQYRKWNYHCYEEKYTLAMPFIKLS